MAFASPLAAMFARASQKMQMGEFPNIQQPEVEESEVDLLSYHVTVKMNSGSKSLRGWWRKWKKKAAVTIRQFPQHFRADC
ncbi:hypothetical protein R1flu_009640 [Riccia fluitans]|uniref:Uncharacterized protein n=1 Tax=Riccia fluitans TaxID=41844 RepID=A0ABD1Z2U0_9MARC